MANEIYERPAAAPVVERPVVVATYSYRAVALVSLIGGIVVALIAIRFLLELFGASTTTDFTSFVYSLTTPLVSPFQGIFPTPARSGYVFDGAALLAVIVYLLATAGVATLVKILTTDRDARAPVE